MQQDEVFRGVCAAMVRVFQLADDRAITRSTTTADIDGWDSLSHSMLIMAIENAFGTELPLDRASQAHDVGELANLVYETVHRDERGVLD